MRDHDKRTTGRANFLVRPRWCVWENVPGAFSSNGGKDFQAVLTEFSRIVCPEAPDVPMPENGKWPKAGCIYDEMGRWSIAWRLHDAQYWGAAQYVDERMFIRGTPQRRKRISVVCDFGGLSAAEVLFERKGLSWDPESCGETWERITAGVEESTGNPVAGTLDASYYKGCGERAGVEREVVLSDAIPLEGNGQRESHRGDGYGDAGDPSFTLNGTEQHAVAYGMCSDASNAMRSSNPNSGFYEADTSRTLDNNGGSPACNQGGMMILSSAGFKAGQSAFARDIGYEKEKSTSLSAKCSGTEPTVVITTTENERQENTDS